jgi:hypothetical protein
VRRDIGQGKGCPTADPEQIDRLVPDSLKVGGEPVNLVLPSIRGGEFKFAVKPATL